MKITVLGIALLCVVPTNASAQERKPQFTPQWQLYELRVSFRDGTQDTGRGVVQDSAVVLRGTPMPLTNIVKVEQSHTVGDPVLNGALIGAAVGLSLNAAVQQRYGHLNEGGSNGLLNLAGASTMGALFGVVVDLMIGNHKEWRTIWPDSP
jgi:hypothetical protein